MVCLEYLQPYAQYVEQTLRAKSNTVNGLMMNPSRQMRHNQQH